MDVQISDITITPRHFSRPPRYTTSRSIVYVHPVGETLIDNLMNRRNRPIKLYREQAIEALKERGVEYSTLSWRQKAGCPCGCSPGFIAEDVRFNGEYQALDIRVDIVENSCRQTEK